MKLIAENRKALHDYALLDELEVGIVLSGQEVKSARQGGMKLRGAYVVVRQGALWLIGSHISPYKPAGPQPDYDPERTRKLLAHKKQIVKLLGRVMGERLTLVPTRAYTSGGRIKLTVSLARSKRAFEKREKLRKRDVDREISRALRKKQ
jgi:SsrA-binding protein